MSRAYRCDSCGGLAEIKDVLTLDVTVPKPNEPGTSPSWSDIDVCRACWSRPLIEVLAEGCDNFPATSEMEGV